MIAPFLASKLLILNMVVFNALPFLFLIVYDHWLYGKELEKLSAHLENWLIPVHSKGLLLAFR